jgi:hypothetical protein
MDEAADNEQRKTEEGAPEGGGATTVARPRFRDGYGLVLVLIIATYFASALGGDDRYGRVVALAVLAVTTWAALRASNVDRRVLGSVAAVLVIVTMSGIAVGALGSDGAARIVTAWLTALLVIVAPVAIARRRLTHRVVNLNTLYSAISLYLMIALFFATSFSLLASVQGDPFFAREVGAVRSTDYLYFSLATITTTGYGDLTARGDLGRLMAMAEAVAGQLYLITVVAIVVQDFAVGRRAGREGD